MVGPGAHALYQDIALEPNAAHTLSFKLYYTNPQTGTFATQPNLDPAAPGTNRQVRADVMKPTAGGLLCRGRRCAAAAVRDQGGQPGAPRADVDDVRPDPLRGTDGATSIRGGGQQRLSTRLRGRRCREDRLPGHCGLGA